MAPAAVVRRHYRITGRVQGVGFRWWASHQARRLGLGGTVANRPDGSVEVQIEGEQESVERFHTLLAEGPALAAVDRIDELPPDDDPLPRPFEITR